MKIPLNDILQIYQKIIKDINVAQISIVIFTALDIDSLCTLKILSKFLKNENILYKIYPVSTYSQLQQKIQDAKTFEKIRLFFFINCGGILDLSKKWFSRTSQIFLFDINKPIHHANIQQQNIKIIDDQYSQFEKAPTSQQYEMFTNMDDQYLEQLEQRQQRNKNKYQIQKQQQDQQQQQIIAKKRNRYNMQQNKNKIQRIRKLKYELTQKIQSYYSQQFYSLPSSYIIYRLIKDLNKLNNQYLWYAIIGVTSMYLQNKLQRQQYDKIYDNFKLDILKYNTIKQDINGISINQQKNKLKKIIDFQFPLLRHWSLYDSIMNSSYMISHLNLWQQYGVKKLYQLLNLIGLSLEQSKQLYKFMLKTSISKLDKQMLTIASQPKFSLFDVAFQSCSKQIDYAFQMSASDYYYILSAIIQRPTKKVGSQEVLLHRVQCFWEAYSLFQTNQAKLLNTIEESKKKLKIVSKQAFNLIQRNNIMNGNNLIFVNFTTDTEDRKIFQHPYSLIKFAYLLMEINKNKKKYTTIKPFIASLQNNITQTSQIVGIINQNKNKFSHKFNLAIQKFKIQAINDNFMGNVITVPKQAVGKIVRQIALL